MGDGARGAAFPGEPGQPVAAGTTVKPEDAVEAVEKGLPGAPLRLGM